MGNIIDVTNDYILECAKLYMQVFNAEPWNDKWTFDTAHKRLKDIYNSLNFEGILYIENGTVKGVVLGNYEQYYDGIHYNLRELFISNELQGKGIGRKLILELEKKLSKLGISTIILFTSKEYGTNKFYLSNNFCEWNSMVIMGKGI